jgi:oligopeptide/dipeptide ABC transporter ATP-binding protein
LTRESTINQISPPPGGSQPGDDGSPVLRVADLTCEIATDAGPIRPVDDVSFELMPGTTLGIVGESGAGKSMLARALMGIAPRSATVTGDVFLRSVNLTGLSRKAHREYLGAGIGLIFQDAMTSLNPVVPIGRRITEVIRFHLHLGREEARARALELLEQVGIADPERRFGQYPHELSGGMRQRVMIAAAIACDPDVLIADEATTALDVTVQRQILDLLQSIQHQRRMAMMIITHDLGIVAGRTDEIIVMYAGQIVERASTVRLFKAHAHRYTGALLSAMPDLSVAPHSEMPTIPGAPPRLASLPHGCRYAPRCAFATDQCMAEAPPLTAGSHGQVFRCIHPAVSPHAEPLAASAMSDEPS